MKFTVLAAAASLIAVTAVAAAPVQATAAQPDAVHPQSIQNHRTAHFGHAFTVDQLQVTASTENTTWYEEDQPITPAVEIHLSVKNLADTARWDGTITDQSATRGRRHTPLYYIETGDDRFVYSLDPETHLLDPGATAKQDPYFSVSFSYPKHYSYTVTILGEQLTWQS